MTANQDYEQLDETQLIFRQIDRINRAVTGDLESMTIGGSEHTMDPGTWSHRVAYGVEFLGSMLEPVLTEERKQKIREELEDYRENTDYESNSPFRRLKTSRIRFKHYIKSLQDHNMAFHESDSFVIDNTEENKDSETPGLEDSDSDVTEEVIE